MEPTQIPQIVTKMDWGIFWTIIGSALTAIALIYQFLRNFRSDFNDKFKESEKKFEILDNRIFLLATGKTLKEIFESEKIKETK